MKLTVIQDENSSYKVVNADTGELLEGVNNIDLYVPSDGIISAVINVNIGINTFDKRKLLRPENLEGSSVKSEVNSPKTFEDEA